MRQSIPIFGRPHQAARIILRTLYQVLEGEGEKLMWGALLTIDERADQERDALGSIGLWESRTLSTIVRERIAV